MNSTTMSEATVERLPKERIGSRLSQAVGQLPQALAQSFSKAFDAFEKTAGDSREFMEKRRQTGGE